jgi:glycerate 2-kinase
MMIKNYTELATSELRREALDIIEAGIAGVLPARIMQSAVSFDRFTRSLSIKKDTYKLSGRLFVIGGGKASGLMARKLEETTGRDAITAGLVIDKADPGEFPDAVIRIIQAGHPLPDIRGVNAMKEMLGLKQRYAIKREDLVVCLLSGGGSSLMPCPIEQITLDDKQKVTGLLLSCGADIYEINAVRKHLSGTKGGRLAQYFAPAGIVSIILSDVIGDDLSVIASGPTFPDPTTFEEVYAILEKYHLADRIPANVRLKIEQGCHGEIGETPKFLDNASNHVIGNVRVALEAMAQKARELGFKPCIISCEQTGDTEKAARLRAFEIMENKYAGYNALLIGGETTPRLPDNHGKGGRNQHYAAVSMLALSSLEKDWVLASIGTDGSDYLPDVAGAMVDNNSLEKAPGRGMDVKRYIDNYDVYPLLHEIGNSIVKTGATGTNVGDIILYLTDS